DRRPACPTGNRKRVAPGPFPIRQKLELADGLPLARADAEQLHQIFSNLLDNAIKYTQPGGPITVSATAGPAEVEVSVADTGPGITPKHLPHIFERFYHVDKACSSEGFRSTGLVLVLAHESIVRNTSTPRGGVRRFRTPRPGGLPVSRSHPDCGAAAPAAESIGDTSWSRDLGKRGACPTKACRPWIPYAGTRGGEDFP
ncbi:hypothetical protein HQ590_03040, partial [bacterium]|nr:hypothetical protein [bacterium]